MTDSGWLGPELPDKGSGERDDVALISSASFDPVHLAQQPGGALDEILRAKAPGALRDTAEERAARIESDRRMVACMAAENFAGPNTKKLLRAAYEYAFPVVGSLIGTRRIFGECVRLGRPVKRQPGDEQWTEDDHAFLTETCVHWELSMSSSSMG